MGHSCFPFHLAESFLHSAALLQHTRTRIFSSEAFSYFLKYLDNVYRCLPSKLLLNWTCITKQDFALGISLLPPKQQLRPPNQFAYCFWDGGWEDVQFIRTQGNRHLPADFFLPPLRIHTIAVSRLLCDTSSQALTLQGRISSQQKGVKFWQLFPRIELLHTFNLKPKSLQNPNIKYGGTVAPRSKPLNSQQRKAWFSPLIFTKCLLPIYAASCQKCGSCISTSLFQHMLISQDIQ